MRNIEKNILWLDMFETLGYNKKIKLLEIAGENTDLRKIFLQNSEIQASLTQEEFNKMKISLDEKILDNRIKEYDLSGVEYITLYSESYPPLLKEIPAPPLCLYCKGNSQLLNTFCIAVVGTRHPTDYGVVVTKQFVKDLSKVDVTIVSGLATGIDTVAHKTALEEMGKTIAVIAGGIKYIYPATNLALANKMIESNLIVSEYNPFVRPQTYYFPARNRIIAGLSKGVLLPEAGEKSGALHTINDAIDTNREIFVIPGKITSPMSAGTNKLAKDYRTSVALSAKDILSAFNIGLKKDKQKPTIQLDMTVQLVLNYISTEKHTFQEIADYSKLKAQELNTILLELEMNGLVTKFGNNSYIAS